jgi:hypothetical protein
MVRRTGKGIVIIGLYVDDSLCIGTKEALSELIQQLKEKGLTVKVGKDLQDYLSCEILLSKDQTKAWIGQPYLIQKLEEKFKGLIENLQDYRTPGTPGTGIVRPKKEQERISDEEQMIYRSGVGMVLYLVKYSGPDIANPV